MVATLLVLGNEFSTPKWPFPVQPWPWGFAAGDADPSRPMLPSTDDNILAERCWLDSKGLFLGVP